MNLDEQTVRRRRIWWSVAAGVAALLVIWSSMSDYFSPQWPVPDSGLTFAFVVFGCVVLYIALSAVVDRGSHVLGSLALPLSFILLGMSAAVLLNHLSERRRKVPVLFEAYHSDDSTSLRMCLRTDGTYEATDAWVVRGEVLYGTYRLDGDTVHLITEDFRFDKAAWTYPKRLVITSKGIVINGYDYSFVMDIIKDERSKL